MGESHQPIAESVSAGTFTPPRPAFALTEAALVEALGADAPGSDAAWLEFHRRHAGRLLGFIRTMAGDLGDDVCEDLLQETVIKVQKGLTRYEHRREGGFHSWCVKIAQNTCLSARRVKAGYPQPQELLSFEAMEEQLAADGEVDRIPLQDALWEEQESASEGERLITEAMSTLTAVDQAVISLRHLIPEPLTDAEIAARVKKPVNQIRMIRNKALRKLKRACEKIMAGRRRRR